MGTCKILFKGRNFTLLLERLKNNGVDLIDIKILTDKSWIITVKHKDLKKVFAISQNMWYNKLIGYGGLMGLFNIITKNLFPILCSIMFVILCFIVDNFVLSVNVVGVSAEKASKIYKIVDDYGIKNYTYLKNDDLKNLSSVIYKNCDDCDFVTVKKSGNRLVINIISKKDSHNIVECPQSILATKSGRIVKLVVYSGTPLKAVGDMVNLKETIVDGYYINNNQEKVAIGCLASYVLECTFVRSYTINNNDVNMLDALPAIAMCQGGIDDVFVTDILVEKTFDLKDSSTYTVKITYLYQEG